MLNKSLAKKDLNITDVHYNPAEDFPERDQHWKDKIRKQRAFNLTKGKGLKDLEVKKDA
jgi:hypothetical protein